MAAIAARPPPQTPVAIKAVELTAAPTKLSDAEPVAAEKNSTFSSQENYASSNYLPLEVFFVSLSLPGRSPWAVKVPVL